MTPPPLPVLPLGTVAGESQLNEESTPGTFTLIIASNFFFPSHKNNLANRVHPRNVSGTAYFTNNRVIFLLVRLNNGIKRLLAGVSVSVGAFGAVMKTSFFFSSSSKKCIPGRLSNSRRGKSQTKEGASESFAL